ncbi:MAG: aldo/keto reductase [Anaeromyxobacter sp.]
MPGPGTAPTLSRLLLGTWRADRWGMDAAALRGFIEAAAGLGVTTVDTADIYCGYGCEALLGAALGPSPGLRARLQLVTKAGIRVPCAAQPGVRVKHYDTSRAYLVGQVERALAALRTDRVEVLLVHRPDPLLDADEVAAAFDDLRRRGLVLAFGVSNFTPAQLELLQSRLPFPLVTNQVECSLAHLAPLLDGTLDQCQRLRLPVQAWSPLGGGRLLQEGGALGARLQETGAELGGAAPDQVALAWLLRHPARIHPVLGTGRLDRLRGAVGALALPLDRQQWFRLLEAAQGREVP